MPPGAHFQVANSIEALGAGTVQDQRPAGLVARMMLNSAVMALSIAAIEQDRDLAPALGLWRSCSSAFRCGACASMGDLRDALMLPVEVRIMPTYKIVADLHLINTYAGLSLPLIASATATAAVPPILPDHPRRVLVEKPPRSTAPGRGGFLSTRSFPRIEEPISPRSS